MTNKIISLFKAMSDKSLLSQFEDDIAYFDNALLDLYPWYQNLSYERKYVLIEMCLCMGLKKLASFEKMLKALSHKNYAQAFVELLNSKWAVVMPIKANKLADILIKNTLMDDIKHGNNQSIAISNQK